MKRSKLLSILLLLSILVCALPLRAEAATSGSCGNNATWKLSNGTLTITGTGPITDFNGQSDVPWYDSLDSITKVVVGEGITTLGNWFCCWAENLTSVSLPSTLTEIDTSAFYQCAKLTEIDIPDSVTLIGYNCFAGCDSLTEIDLPDSLKTLGTQVFYGSKGLTSIVVPESVTSIGASAFYSCEALTSVTLPSTLTAIPSGCFAWSGITSLTIPKTVTSIGKDAFYMASKLKDVYISDLSAWCAISFPTATSQPLSKANNLHLNGELITNLVLPENITAIGGYAFYGCRSITSLTIPETVTSIGNNAFQNCSLLDEITFEGTPSIGTSAFASCSGLDKITFKDAASIGDHAFSSCANLTEITFEGNAPTFGATVFSGVTANAYYPISNKTFTDEIRTADYGGTITWVACCDDGNHSYKETVIAPTCTTQGYTLHTCTKCEYSYKDSYVDVTHSYDDLFVCTLCGAKNYTYTGTCGSNVYWRLSNEGTLAIYGSGAMWDYISYASSPWYSYVSSIKRVDVHNGVTHIGDYMFYFLSQSTSIALPPSVKTIGTGNFSYNNNLKDVYITDMAAWCSITYEATTSHPFLFAENLYLNGELVTHADIPEGTASISKWAFYNCKTITSVTIPESVTAIGTYAFQNCTALEEVHYNAISAADLTSTDYAFKGAGSAADGIAVTIGAKVTGIPAYLFYSGSGTGATPIISLSFAEGSVCRNISTYAFADCSGLNELNLPSSLTSIGAAAFKNCTGLSDLVLPDQITSIGDNAFQGCNGIQNLTLPKNVTSIGTYAFSGLINLTELVIPESVTTIGTYAFYNCKSVADIRFNATAMSDLSSNNYVFYGAGISIDGTKVTIGKNVTKIPAYLFAPYNTTAGSTNITAAEFEEGSVCKSIGTYAFGYCGKLTFIVLPPSITDYGSNAFVNCSSLTDIYITDLKAWCNLSFPSASCNPLYYAENLYVNDILLTDLVIPEGTTAIGSYTFFNCASLISVAIPESVKTIGTGAFQNCTALTEIRYNAVSAADLTSSSCAFKSTGNSTDGIAIIIGADVVMIPAYLFDYCSWATSITFESGSALESIGSYTFSRCSRVTEIAIPASVTAIDSFAFASCSGLTRVDITDMDAWYRITFGGNFSNPMFNGTDLYLNGELVTNLVIPEGMETINDYTFYGCESLTSVTFPESLTSIGQEAFRACTSLTSVTANNNLEYIGIYAFSGCSNLAEVNLTGNLSTIDIAAFNACPALSTVTLGEKLTTLESEVFRNCSALTSITIPASVTTLNGCSFENCTALKDVTFRGAPPTAGRYVFYGVTATIHYPLGMGWTEENMTPFHEGATALTWVAYCPAAPEHAFTNYVSNGDATCTEDGTETAACDYCGVTDTRTAVGSALGHNYSGGACTRCGGYQIISSGTCGDNLTWELNSHYDLTISGSGDMDDYEKMPPWSVFSENIVSVTVEDGITSIGSRAFTGCTAMTELSLPDSIRSIGDLAFFYCTKLTTFTIPENVTHIGELALYGCSKVQKLTVPASVTAIGPRAFGGTRSLTSFSVDTENPNYCTDSSGVLFSKNKSVLIFAPEYLANIYTIPSTVLELEDHAFCDCTQLKQLNLPDGLTTIGEYAFANCTGLTTITIPASVTHIGECAFVGCTSLNYIVVADGNAAYMDDDGNVLYDKDQTRLIWSRLATGHFITPDTVTVIDHYAFDGNTHLTGITFPAGLERINMLAFSDCTNLKEIKFLGSAPASIDAYGFLNVTADVYYPMGDDSWTTDIRQDYGGSLTWIAYDPDIAAAGTCGTNLTWVLGTNGVLTISGSGAMATYTSGTAPWFDCAAQIRTLVIDSGVTTIGNYAFADCTALAAVTIPDTVTKIGSSSFYNCDALLEITIPGSVTSIGSYALAYSGNLARITFLGDAPSISSTAFKSLTATCSYPHKANWTSSKLTSYGGTITWVANCYAGHNAVTDAAVPATCTTDGLTEGSHCDVCGEILIPQETIPATGHTPVADEAVPAACTTDGLTEGSHCDICGEILVPQETIPATGHTPVTDEAVPAACTTDGLTEGSHCDVCKEILVRQEVVPATGHHYQDGSCTICHEPEPGYAEKIASGWSGYTTWTLTSDGVLTFSGEGPMKEYTYKSEMPWYQYFDKITRVVLEKGVTSIGDYAFYAAPNLESITIPDTVTTIGDYAFKNAPKINNVVLPKNLTSLGDSAFYACTGLTHIEIPAGLWTIKPYTFKNCVSLISVTFHEGNLQKISDGAFYGTGLTELVLPDCLSILDVFAFKGCAKLESITIGSGLTELREAVFYGTAISTITVPEGITRIGPYAFKNCVKLETINLPSTLKSIGEASFYADTALKAVELPNAVTTIGNYAFRKCTAIKTLSLGSGLVTIGESSFYGCTGITSLNLPRSVTTIMGYAFKGCTGLKTVNLSSTLTTLGESAFHSCTALEEITIPTKVTYIGEYCFSGSSGIRIIEFLGNAPAIGNGAFNKITATSYYPIDNATWTTDVMQNYGGTITWTAF